MSKRLEIKTRAACRTNADAMTAVLNQHLRIYLRISFGCSDRKRIH